LTILISYVDSKTLDFLYRLSDFIYVKRDFHHRKSDFLYPLSDFQDQTSGILHYLSDNWHPFVLTQISALIDRFPHISNFTFQKILF
jgi:hypothetical protein